MNFPAGWDQRESEHFRHHDPYSYREKCSECGEEYDIDDMIITSSGDEICVKCLEEKRENGDCPFCHGEGDGDIDKTDCLFCGGQDE